MFKKEARKSRMRSLFFSLLLLLCQAVSAQDSTETKELGPLEREEKIARKAAIKSSVIPGWGQVQNGGGHILKIPLIYAGIGSLAYLSNANHERYKCNQLAYRYALDDDPNTIGECDGIRSSTTLKSNMDFFHKQRDMFILMTIGAYALQILDAYVWAHLAQFDNSDDLSLSLNTSFTNIAGRSTPVYGIKLKF